MFNNNSTKTNNKRTVKELFKKNKNKKIVFIDTEKEFNEIVKSSENCNCTDHINFLEDYEP